MGTDILHLRDVLATLASGSLAFALVKSLETLAVRGTLKQVLLFYVSEQRESFLGYRLHTYRYTTACLQKDCAHVHRPIVCPDLAHVQVLTLTHSQLDLQLCQAIVTLPMLHAAQCRIICSLVCCISAVPQWCEVSTCSKCSISCTFAKLETAIGSVPGLLATCEANACGGPISCRCHLRRNT